MPVLSSKASPSEMSFYYNLLLLCSRLKRNIHGGCYSRIGLPLIENSTIVEQPLDLWTLTEQYKSAALRIIHNARYNEVALIYTDLTPS